MGEGKKVSVKPGSVRRGKREKNHRKEKNPRGADFRRTLRCCGEKKEGKRLTFSFNRLADQRGNHPSARRKDEQVGALPSKRNKDAVATKNLRICPRERKKEELRALTEEEKEGKKIARTREKREEKNRAKLYCQKKGRPSCGRWPRGKQGPQNSVVASQIKFAFGVESSGGRGGGMLRGSGRVCQGGWGEKRKKKNAFPPGRLSARERKQTSPFLPLFPHAEKGGKGLDKFAKNLVQRTVEQKEKW